MCSFTKEFIGRFCSTNCVENEFFKDFQDTSESSDDNTNVVNAPREPIVVNQDPVENSSPSPLHIDHCCHECGDSLDGIFCRQCTCKSCGKVAHYGYFCPPRIRLSLILTMQNQNIDGSPLQNVQGLQQQCLLGTCQRCGCNEYDGVCFYCKVGNETQINVSTPYSSNDSPSVANHPPQPQYVHTLGESGGSDSHYSTNLMEQMTSICDMVGQIMQKKEEERRIAEDQAAKNRYWKIPICYDDDEDYTIAITPVLSTKEADNSLSMGDEHLDTIPATELDEVIKSSVENLVPIPSEFKGISKDTCDVPVCEDPSTFDALSDHSEISSESNNDGTSSDDDSYENIEYIEASPLNLEIVSLEEVNEDQEEKEFDLEDIFQIQDVILREKLLNISRLVTNIESLKDNPTPDHVLKSPSSFPIPIVDSDSFFEESDTSFSYSDNSLPEFKTFSDHTEETRSGSTTTHANNSLPEYDSFLFEVEPDQGGLISIVISDNSNIPSKFAKSLTCGASIS
ncbi:hypothetical protein Tco_1383863 [Tanacetum coccineum]